MQIDRIIKKIESLDFWQGQPLKITPIEGGLTNYNFQIDTENKTYFGRYKEDRHDLGVFCRNELACHQQAANMDLAPNIVFEKNGIVISEFVEGTVLKEDHLKDLDLLLNLGQSLKKVHESYKHTTGELTHVCPFVIFRTYIDRCKKYGCKIPKDWPDIYAKLEQLEKTLSQSPAFFCHGDYKFSNVIIDANKKIWLVDWEFAGIGTYPFFDLAWLSASIFIDDDKKDIQILKGYLGESPSDKQLFEYKTHKALSLLRDALWALVQTKNDYQMMDYQAYADEYFDHYRKFIQLI